MLLIKMTIIFFNRSFNLVEHYNKLADDTRSNDVAKKRGIEAKS